MVRRCLARMIKPEVLWHSSENSPLHTQSPLTANALNNPPLLHSNPSASFAPLLHPRLHCKLTTDNLFSPAASQGRCAPVPSEACARATWSHQRSGHGQSCSVLLHHYHHRRCGGNEAKMPQESGPKPVSGDGTAAPPIPNLLVMEPLRNSWFRFVSISIAVSPQRWARPNYTSNYRIVCSPVKQLFLTNMIRRYFFSIQEWACVADICDQMTFLIFLGLRVGMNVDAFDNANTQRSAHCSTFPR